VNLPPHICHSPCFAAFSPASHNTVVVVSTPSASEGHPMGNKNAKLALDMTPAAERLQSCLVKCIADVTTNNVLRDEKYDVRWVMMFEN
jgi:hypothetical protein